MLDQIKKLYPNKTIIKRVLFSASLVFVLVGIIGSGLIIVDYEGQLRSVENAEYFDISVKSEHFAPTIERAAKILIDIRDAFIRDGGVPSKIQKKYRYFFNEHGDYEWLELVDLKGNLLFQTGSYSRMHRSEMASSFIKKNVAKLRLGEILLRYDIIDNNKINSKPRLYMVTRLKSKAAVVLVVKLENLLRYLSKIIVGNIGTAYLLDHKGENFVRLSTLPEDQSVDTSFLKSAKNIELMMKVPSAQQRIDEGLITFDRVYPTSIEHVVGKRVASFNYKKSNVKLFFQDLILVSHVSTRKLHHATAGRIRNEIYALLLTLFLVTALLYLYHVTKYHEQQSVQKLEEQDSQVKTQAHMATLGELSAGIAHEINNPLTILIGATEEILYNINGKEIQKDMLVEDANTVKNTTIRIANIVKGLRSVTRNAADDPFERATVRSVISDAAVICNIKLKKNGVKLKMEEIPEDLTIECRAAQVSQIVLNLMGNAIDAIKEMEDPWIEVNVKDAGEMVEISIIDSGDGIPEEVANKLFTQFFTTKKKGEGTGLGLTISKRIIEEHHGDLTLNRGNIHTEFVVTLPKKQPSLDS